MASKGHEYVPDILGETTLALSKNERKQRQRHRVCRWKRTKRTSSKHMGPAHSIQLPVVENDNNASESHDEYVSGDDNSSHGALDDLCVHMFQDVFDEEDAVSVLRIEELEEALLRVRLEGDPEMDALMFDESEEFDAVLNSSDTEIGPDNGPGSLWDDLQQMSNKTGLSSFNSADRCYA